MTYKIDWKDILVKSVLIGGGCAGGYYLYKKNKKAAGVTVAGLGILGAVLYQVWRVLAKKPEEEFEETGEWWAEFQCITMQGIYPSDVDIPGTGIIALPETPTDLTPIFDIVAETYTPGLTLPRRRDLATDARWRIKQIAPNIWTYNHEDEDLFPRKIYHPDSPTGYSGNDFNSPSLLVGIIGDELWIKVLCDCSSYTGLLLIGETPFCEIVGSYDIRTVADVPRASTVCLRDGVPTKLIQDLPHIDELPIFKFKLEEVPRLR